MSFRVVNGNTHTENGWRCCNRDECDLVQLKDLYFTNTAPLRKGAPLTILGAWMFWYDRNVEEILSSIWAWSLSNDVLGQPGRNNGSNHLSATAIDVNAPKYPWGTPASKVMSVQKIAKIRQGMALFSLTGRWQDSLIYWGDDWNFKDPMHFQMRFREGDARNEQFAKKLRDGYLGIWAKEALSERGLLMALTPAEEKEVLQAARDIQEVKQTLNLILEVSRYTKDQLGEGFDAWGEDGDLGKDSKGRRNTLRSAMAKIMRSNKAA